MSKWGSGGRGSNLATRPEGERGKMENANQWVKVKDWDRGTQDAKSYRDVACRIALVATFVFGFLGTVGLLTARDPEEKATAHRVLQAARVSGDVVETVCKC